MQSIIRYACAIAVLAISVSAFTGGLKACDGYNYDECGVCKGPGIPEGFCDCDGNTLDCDGICGGGHTIDACGECNGPGILPGKCDCAGREFDGCGECGGTNEAMDCNGMCEGHEFHGAQVDECGVCTGGNTTLEFNGDKDCEGTCFGEAMPDSCGDCNGGDAAKDCLGNCHGGADCTCAVDNWARAYAHLLDYDIDLGQELYDTISWKIFFTYDEEDSCEFVESKGLCVNEAYEYLCAASCGASVKYHCDNYGVDQNDLMEQATLQSHGGKDWVSDQGCGEGFDCENFAEFCPVYCDPS